MSPRFLLPMYRFLYDTSRTGPAGSQGGRRYARCWQTAPQRGNASKVPHLPHLCQHFLLQSNLKHGSNHMDMTLHHPCLLALQISLLCYYSYLLPIFLLFFFSCLQVSSTYFLILIICCFRLVSKSVVSLSTNLQCFLMSTINYTINVV